MYDKIIAKSPLATPVVPSRAIERLSAGSDAAIFGIRAPAEPKAARAV